MQLPSITSYRPEQPTPEFSFYALSKGNNAGKPLREPCANCFTVRCSDPTSVEFWYNVSWGLWKCRKFEIYLRGSVIPFILIGDYFSELTATGERVMLCPEFIQRALHCVREIEKLESQQRLKLKLLHESKLAIFRMALK